MYVVSLDIQMLSFPSLCLGQCADTPAAKIANTNKSIVNSAPEMDTSGPQSSSKHGQRTPDSPVEPAKRPGRRYPTYALSPLG